MRQVRGREDTDEDGERIKTLRQGESEREVEREVIDRYIDRNTQSSTMDFWPLLQCFTSIQIPTLVPHLQLA
jgi:hypothetical protein